jgi:hypothetical protein
MPDPAGTACPEGATCDVGHGAICNPIDTTCAAITIAKPGEACGLIGGSIALCGPGDFSLAIVCKGFVPPSATQPMGAPGLCQTPAADGAMCNNMTGPACIPPSICVDGSCNIKDPSACR